MKINFNISEFPSLHAAKGRLSSQMMKVSPSIEGLLRETKAEHACSAAGFCAAAFTRSAARLMHPWVFVKASWRMYHRGSPCPHNDTVSYKNNPTHDSTPCFCQPGMIAMITYAGLDCCTINFLHGSYSEVVFGLVLQILSTREKCFCFC